jgi:polyisoprenoid-binding protein YceI
MTCAAGPSKGSNGRARLGFSVPATIKRTDFRVSWVAASEPHVPVVSDEVELTFDLQVIAT